MKIKEITEDRIEFDDGTVITQYHSQECCESVYAEFEALKDTNIWVEDFKKLNVKGVEDSGIFLNGYFIPCYNSQNGYYSSSLSITISHPAKGKELAYNEVIDISDFVLDQID